MLRNRGGALVLTAAIAAGAAACHDHDHDPTLPWGRLLVSDATEAKVRLVDIDDAEVIATYDTEAPARVYAGPGNRYAFAVQGSANLVQVVDGGSWMVWHDDHYDRFKESPRLLDFRLETERPTDVVAAGGWLTVFNDGDGTVSAVNEQHLRNSALTPREATTARPHHGVGLMLRDHLLASAPDMSDLEVSLGVGVSVFDAEGEETASFDGCPGVHGAATKGDAAVFGCRDGVLIVKYDNGTFSSTKAAPPSDVPEGARVGTLRAHRESAVFLGNLGGEDLSRIDPAAGTITRIALPGAHVAWDWDATGTRAVVLLADGSLHLVNVASGDIVASRSNVVPAYDLAATPRPTRPVLAADPRAIYVTSPTKGEIVEVLVHELKINETISVGGTPSGLALLGHP